MTTKLSPNSDERLDQAIAGIRARAIPAFPSPSIEFPGDAARPKPHATSAVSLRSRRRWIAAVGGLSLAAAALLAAVTISTWPTDVWAQVVKAVQKQAWVRLRMSSPDNPAPDKQPIVEVWFSSEKQIGAGRVPGSTLFVELERHRKQRYDETERTIYISDADQDEGEFASLDAVLQSFSSQNVVQHPKTARAKLLSQSRQERRDGDKVWTDFIFNYEDSRRTPPQYRRVFQVPEGSKLPTSMKEEWTYDGKTVSRVMAIDYPESGPADLHALNVPKDAKVINSYSSSDLQSVLTAYATHQRAVFDSYSTMSLVTMTEKQDWKWFNEIYKVRHNPSGYTSEVSDMQLLLNLCMQIHEGKVTLPDKEADRQEWWKTESAKLGFKALDGDTAIQVFVPDRVGYPLLGLPRETVRATLDPKPAIGPSETVLITIEDSKSGQMLHRYWLSPKRDLFCLRSEHFPASEYGRAFNKAVKYDDWIHTTLVESTSQSPTGRWYATQLRCGAVKQSGGDLMPRPDLEGVPYATTTWRYLVEFQK